MQHDFGRHGGGSSQYRILRLVALMDELQFFGEAEIDDLIYAFMLHDVFCLQVAMDDAMSVQFLYRYQVTAIPLMMCLKMSTDSASENFFRGCASLRALISSASVLPPQYSMMSILRSLFSKMSKSLMRLGLSHCLMSVGSD